MTNISSISSSSSTPMLLLLLFDGELELVFVLVAVNLFSSPSSDLLEDNMSRNDRRILANNDVDETLPSSLRLDRSREVLVGPRSESLL